MYGKDDDWTLVVPSATLIEAAINQGILGAVRPGPAAEFLSKRPISEKVRIARDIGLFPEDMAKRINAVSRIRNAVVHDLTAFNFSLPNYLSLKPEFKNEIAKPLARTPEGESGGVEAVMTHPRWAVFAAALEVISFIIPRTWEPTFPDDHR